MKYRLNYQSKGFESFVEARLWCSNFVNGYRYEHHHSGIKFVFLILASVSRWTTDKVRLHWDIGHSFEYLGYFAVGYSIRKMSGSKSNHLKAIIMIFFEIVFEVCAAGLEYKQIIDGIAESDLKFRIVSSSR